MAAHNYIWRPINWHLTHCYVFWELHNKLWCAFFVSSASVEYWLHSPVALPLDPLTSPLLTASCWLPLPGGSSSGWRGVFGAWEVGVVEEMKLSWVSVLLPTERGAMIRGGNPPLSFRLSGDTLEEVHRSAPCLGITDSSSEDPLPPPHLGGSTRLQTGGIELDESESDQLLLRFWEPRQRPHK